MLGRKNLAESRLLKLEIRALFQACNWRQLFFAGKHTELCQFLESMNETDVGFGPKLQVFTFVAFCGHFY